MINTTQASSIFVDNGTGTETGIDLSIQYIKQLYIHMNKRVALMNATTENITSVAGGTAIYYISRRNIVRDYSAGKKLPDAVHEFQVQIVLDQRKEILFSYESLDLLLLGAQFKGDNLIVSQAFVNGWLDGRAKSVEAYFYAKLTELAVKTIQSQESIIDLNIDSSKQSEIAELRAQVWLPIANKIAELQSLVTSTYIGLSPEDYTLWVSPKLANYLLLSTTTLGGDSSKKSLEDGVIMEIAGIKIIQNPFIGKDYGINTFDQLETFDFTAVDGMLIHKESLAFPFNKGVIKTTIDPLNGNFNFLHKFVVNKNGGQALRPSTISGFKLNISNPVQPNKK